MATGPQLNGATGPVSAGGPPKGGTTGAVAGAQAERATGPPKGGTTGAAGGARTEGAGVEPAIGLAVEGCTRTVGAMVTTRAPIDVAALEGAADLVGKDGFVVTLDIVGAGDGCDAKFLTITALES